MNIPKKTIPPSLLLLASTVCGFTTPPSQVFTPPTLALQATTDVLVISPPGGIGELTSLESAKAGSHVKWFVVSDNSDNDAVELPSELLSAIAESGGSISLAGGDAASLVEDVAAREAVKAWCSGKAVLCTYDGAESGNEEGRARLIEQGVRVAAQIAVGHGDVVKVAALGSGVEMDDGEASPKGGDGEGEGLLGGLFGRGSGGVPETLKEAMGDLTVVRYGELFGAPESSPESSPFVGGPRLEPIIRDMYTMRSIRIDPTISVSGNILSGGSKSNRLAIASSLTRLATKQLQIPKTAASSTVDIALSSYPGTQAPTDEEWNAEFQRALQMISSPTGGATLFSSTFASVPSTLRLAEWLATKWAPAILRSYDIAGTRVGARPVYATQNENVVELIWQDLVDFNPVTCGKMRIVVEDGGITASRGAGDVAAGFGSVSMRPLPGEDILVRRLADAAAQAIEKGLAIKSNEQIEAAKQPATTAAPTPQVISPLPQQEQPQSTASDAGPRSSGVRRSSERARGRKRKENPPSSGSGSFE